MQRMELMAIGRHSFDQLASGGSLMRVVASHAASLAEAMGEGTGGLAAGFNALAAGALRFVKTFGLPIAAIAGGLAAIGMAKGAVKDLEADRLMAGRVNMDVSDLDALRKTVRELGGDTKETDRVFERFANRMDDAFAGKALEGGKGDKIMKTLAGIGVHAADGNGKLKDTKTLLTDVAGALETMSDKRRSEALRELGFSSPRHGQTDPGLEKLLTGGRAAMEGYIAKQKELGVVTKEQVETARKYKLAVDELSERWRNIRDELAVHVLPVLTAMFDAFREGVEWLRLNSTLVQGFGIAFVVMATAVSAAMWTKLIPAFTALALRVLAATWPFVLIAAAVLAVGAAFAAVYEDVQFFLRGQPSLLGELINKYAWVRKAVDLIGAGFKWVAKEGKEVWETLTRGAKAFAEGAGPILKGLWEIIGPLLRLIFDAAMALGKVLAPLAGGLVKTIGGILAALGSAVVQIAQLVVMALTAAAKAVGPIFSEMFKDWRLQIDAMVAGLRQLGGLRPDAAVNANLGIGAGMLHGATTSPFAAIPPSAWQTRGAGGSRTVHIGKVEVHTQATDPDAIARSIGPALQTELRRTASTFDNGIER